MKEIKSIINKHRDKTSEEISIICKLDESLNARLYKINYQGNISILKLYKSNDELRFQREKRSLEILNKNKFKYCPKLFYFDNFNKYLIIENLNGVKPISNNKFKCDLARYIDNQQKFVSLSDKKLMVNAAESGFSINEHLEIVKNKAEHILSKLVFNNETKETIKFISKHIIPWLNSYGEKLESHYNFHQKIRFSERIFSQSDIGIHNTFLNNQNIYTFDYEYAGLDDPAKTICDLLIHPDQLVEKDDFAVVLEIVSKIGIFKKSIKRLKTILPIYRYKWFLIVINSYLKKERKESELSIKVINKAFDYLSISEKIN